MLDHPTKLKQIYSYAFIDPKSLKETTYSVATARNDRGRETYRASILHNGKLNQKSYVSSSYFLHDPRLVVDMPYIGKKKAGANANGWQRSSYYYFKSLYEEYPKAFSKRNIKRVENGVSIKVDKTFTSVFPQFSPFAGKKLVHHHIGEGSQAVAIPKKLHIGHGGIHQIENQLGITESEKDFTDFYVSNCRALNVSEAREKYLEERLGDTWKNQLDAGNDYAYFLNDQSNIERKRAYSAEFSRVLNIPSSPPPSPPHIDVPEAITLDRASEYAVETAPETESLPSENTCGSATSAVVSSSGIPTPSGEPTATGRSISSDCAVHVTDLNALKSLSVGMLRFERRMKLLFDNLNDSFNTLGKTYLDDGYNILREKIERLGQAVEASCELSKKAQIDLEDKINNLEDQIRIASED